MRREIRSSSDRGGTDISLCELASGLSFMTTRYNTWEVVAAVWCMSGTMPTRQ
jgi:hypothetical protein